MNDDRWLKLQEIFEAGWALDEAGRQSLLAEQAGGDPVLRKEAEALLSTYDDERRAQVSAPADVAQRRFGAWRTERLLGRGGMGEVWLAHRADGQHEQRAALKIMSRHLATAEYYDRFRRERQLLARLEHPNIARLLDGGVSEAGEPYLVMEYVEGRRIDDYCTDHKVPLHGRLELVRALCAAIESAHRSLILHRDIKPSNVLVTADGALKLVDFGAGREVGSGSLQTSVPVTPAYASPEQLRGDPVTMLSDVYGLGATLYALLSGEAPYGGGSRRSSYEVMRSVLEDEPPVPSAAVPDTPKDLDAIVLKAMAKNPMHRYASAERLSADLQSFLEHRPIEARSHTWMYRTGRFVERHRLGVGFAALLSVSLLSGVALIAREAKIAREQRTLAERRFNDVRQLARTFLFDFHDAIQNLPGATPARRLVVDKALLYLNSLSQEAGNDRALEGELAEAYLRVAEVQGTPGVPNLGDTAGALDSYGRALEISERAARRDPQAADWKRYLLRAHRGLGDILAARNDPASALPHYQEAARIVETTAPPGAQDLAAQFDVVNVYSALADCLGNPGLANVGDPRGAKDSYEKARRRAQSIAASHPENQRAQRAVALMEMRIGDVEMGSGDMHAALDRYQSAAKVSEDAVAQDPLNPATLLVLSNIRGKVGAALESLGQTGAALAEYQRACDIGRQLMEADPKNEQSKNSYALSLRARANLLATSGHTASALVLDREARAIFRQLLNADPGSARRQAVYAQTLATIGELSANEPAYLEAMGLFKALAARSAATPEDLSNFAEHLLACPFPDIADPKQGLVMAQRALALTRTPQPAYLERLAQAYWATGDAAGAAANQRRAAALWPVSSPQRQRAQAMLAKFEASGNR